MWNPFHEAIKSFQDIAQNAMFYLYESNVKIIDIVFSISWYTFWVSKDILYDSDIHDHPPNDVHSEW